MTNWNHSVINDDEEQRKFADNLGYALLNCGVIEQLTYTYAATLTDKHIFGTSLGGKSFSVRKKNAIDLLLQADIDEELRKKAIALWGETTEVMQVRNLIAHNPITHVRIGRAEGGEESMMAVVDMARSKQHEIQHLDIAKIANLANRAQVIIEGLFRSHAAIKESLSE